MTQYTPNYNLDLYEDTDKPNLRDQYNSAMGKIDVALGNASIIPDNSITTSKLATGAVTTTKIADDAITDDKIADGAITNGKIANYAVGNDNLVDGSINGYSKIVDNSISGIKIMNGAITSAKIANDAITDQKLSNILTKAVEFIDISSSPKTIQPDESFTFDIVASSIGGSVRSIVSVLGVNVYNGRTNVLTDGVLENVKFNDTGAGYHFLATFKNTGQAAIVVTHIGIYGIWTSPHLIHIP